MVVERSHECPIPGIFQGQTGQSSEQPDLVTDHSRSDEVVVVDNFLDTIQSKSFYDPVTPYIKCHAQYINWDKLAGRVQLPAWGQAGYWSRGGETLFCASLAFFGIYFSLFNCHLPFYYNYVTVCTTSITVLQS